MAICAGLALGFAASAGLALPPDPQRPFVARTCAEATARLHEAKMGNPLISKAEMEEVVAQAQAQAEALCGPGGEQTTDQENLTSPGGKGR